MSRSAGLSTVVSLALCLCVASLRAAEAPQRKAAPAVYFTAPTLTDTPGVSPLPVEAALRAAAVDLGARGTYASFVPIDQTDTLSPDAWPRVAVRKSAEPAPGKLFVVIERAGKETARADLSDIRTDSWANLASTTAVVAGEIADFASAQLSLPARAPTTTLADDDKSKLAEAYKRILASGPMAGVSQASMIDTILGAYPTSAEALRAACWPSLIIATQDVYGSFSLRDRLLAVPLSWWVAAERISPASTSTDKLTGAWVAFLCGFPAEAKTMLDTLQSRQTLATALDMFVTRDWRTVDEAKIAAAPYITQVAWVWAIQACSTAETSHDALMAVVTARKEPSLGTLVNVGSVELGHRLTSFMPPAFATRDLSVLLQPGILPDGDREALTTAFAGRFTAHGDKGQKDSLRTAVSTFAKQLSEDAPDPQALQTVERVYQAALRTPDGPLCGPPDAPDSWQSLSPWAYAQSARALFERSVEQRAYFLSDSWGVPDRARAFTSKIKVGTASSPSGHFFRAIANRVADDYKTAGNDVAELMKTPLGLQLRTWRMLSDWFNDRWLDEMREYYKYPWTPVGCWSYEDVVAPDLGKGGPYAEWSKTALELDPYCYIAGNDVNLAQFADSDFIPFATKMSYNRTVMWRLINYAVNKTKGVPVREMLDLAISADPGYIFYYSSLSDYYKKSGDEDKAIDILMKGCDTCPWSVYVSNEMGRLTYMLADKGRNEEAVRYGKRASESYSGRGLLSYAYALHKAGRDKESLEIYRKAAERYHSCTGEYLDAAFDCGQPAANVLAEAKRLADAHAPQDMMGYVVPPFLWHGHLDDARTLVEGNNAKDNLIPKLYYLGLYYLLKNDTTQAIAQFSQAVHSKGFLNCVTNYEADVLGFLYYSASLADDEETLHECRLYMRAMIEKAGSYRALFDHALLTTPPGPDKVITDPDVGADVLTLVLAAESERRRATPKAIELYKLIADYETAHRHYMAAVIARARLALLAPEKPPVSPSAPGTATPK